MESQSKTETMHGRCSILQEKNRFEISLFDKYLEKPDSLCLCGTNIYKRYYSRSIQIHLFRKLHKILTHSTFLSMVFSLENLGHQ